MSDAVWSIRQGDDWRRTWTTDEDVSGWDVDTLLVQLRAGPDKSATLLASSDPDDSTEDVALIDTTGTSFGAGGGTLALHIDDEDTSTLPVNHWVWIEAQCEIDGDVTTFLPAQKCPVTKQLAERVEP